jgi:hypothetical protein
MGSSPINAFGPVYVTAVTDGGATETVIATLSNVSVDTVQKNVNISGFVNITPGTNGVAVILKVRRGTTTSGTEVGTAENSIAVATDKITIPYFVNDQPGPSDGASYVLTSTTTSASADGTVNEASIWALVTQ